MKFIIDPKLINRLESDQLRPNRLFYCSGCNSNYQRNSVKKVQADYFCIHCGKPVQDITNTDDGKQLISLLGM